MVSAADSSATLSRALTFLNGVIVCVEAGGFPITVEQGKHGELDKLLKKKGKFKISKDGSRIGLSTTVV
jgi:hypothetical protein